MHHAHFPFLRILSIVVIPSTPSDVTFLAYSCHDRSEAWRCLLDGSIYNSSLARLEADEAEELATLDAEDAEALAEEL